MKAPTTSEAVAKPSLVAAGFRHRDPASISKNERLLLALAEMQSDVNSGGFDFYLRYPHRKNAPTASEAARLAGCPPSRLSSRRPSHSWAVTCCTMTTRTPCMTG
jgi:hypothetical protein